MVEAIGEQQHELGSVPALDKTLHPRHPEMSPGFVGTAFLEWPAFGTLSRLPSQPPEWSLA